MVSKSKILYRTWLIAVIIIALILVFAKVAAYNQTLVTSDGGEYLNNAWRVLNGDIPYKDFWLLFSPAEVYMPTIALKIFGLNFNLILLGSAIVPLLISLLLFFILREIKCNAAISITSSILFLMEGNRLFYFLLCLLSFYFLLLFISHKKYYLIILSGVLVGIAFQFRVYHVAPYYISALVFLLVMRRKINSTFKWKSIFAFVVASAVPTIICMVMLRDILPQLWNAVMFESVVHGTSMKIPYWFTAENEWHKIFFYLDLRKTFANEYPLKGLPFMIAAFLYQLLQLLLPFIISLIFIGNYFKKQIDFFSPVNILLLIWGILELPYALNFADEFHIRDAYSPMLILLFIFWNDFYPQKSSFTKTIFSIFIFVIIFTNSLQVYQQLKATSAKEYHLQSSTISLKLFNKTQFDKNASIINFIHQNSSKGDYIFSLSWNTIPIYAITERRNPTYYDSPVDMLVKPSIEKQEKIMNALTIKKTKIIILETGNQINLYNNYNIENSNPVLISFIKKNYQKKMVNGNIEIYLLNNQDSTNY